MDKSSNPAFVAMEAGTPIEVNLHTIIDERPLHDQDPYVLLVLDSEASTNDQLHMMLRAGGFEGPMSVYGFMRAALATLASGGAEASELDKLVRVAVRALLVEAGVAKAEVADPPWLAALLDGLVAVAVAR